MIARGIDHDMDELVLARCIEAVRAGGRHASWDYHSRASAVHRYVAMTVPKVAHTTIKWRYRPGKDVDPSPTGGVMYTPAASGRRCCVPDGLDLRLRQG